MQRWIVLLTANLDMVRVWVSLFFYIYKKNEESFHSCIFKYNLRTVLLGTQPYPKNIELENYVLAQYFGFNKTSKILLFVLKNAPLLPLLFFFNIWILEL